MKKFMMFSSVVKILIKNKWEKIIFTKIDMKETVVFGPWLIFDSDFCFYAPEKPFLLIL